MSTASVDLRELAEAIDGRFGRLSELEQRTALVIHRELARGVPVSDGAVARETNMLPEELGALIRDWPGMYRDEEGDIIGFWGLATREMPHRFLLGDRQLFAWCAWDSLFLPELLGQTARVVSTCPVTGKEIRLQVGPDGVEDADPADAVVSMLDPGRIDVEGDRAISSFCHDIHFFASRQVGQAWIDEKKDGGFVLTLSEAFELGRLTNAIRYGDSLSTLT